MPKKTVDVLTEKVDEIDRKIQALFLKFDSLVDPVNGIFCKLNLRAEKNATSIKTISWLVCVIVLALIGLVIKSAL